jgi:hypothetical protein
MMTLFEDKNNEFNKLTPVDRDLCIDLLDQKPQALRSWVEYVAADYLKKGVTIDSANLLRELTEFADKFKRLDDE